MSSLSAAQDKDAKFRDVILDAAKADFADHGFFGLSLRRVARRAGVNAALVSYYFGSRRELLAAVAEAERA